MSLSFSSADEFLDYIKVVRVNPITSIQSAPNLEFARINNERWRGLEMPVDPHDHIVRELWQEIQAILPNDFLEKTRNRLVVGALDDISFNALCMRSPEGFFAIVMNSGLLTLFNKVSKLQIAAAEPNSIVYCNRGAAEGITTSLAKEWFVEVCEHYRATGKPLGPQIHLAPIATAKHTYQLHVWELFVLAHELGHLLAGHLEQECAWTHNAAFGMVDAYVDNQSHHQETEADILAYVMLRESIYKRQTKQSDASSRKVDDRPLLSTVITLFDLLFLLGSCESQTHPHPLDRVCNIASAVYGKSFAERLASTYGDHNLIGELFSTPLVPQHEMRG